jgi:hypothetical protein
MRTNFGHLAFDGREYIDAANYPVSRRWAQGYGHLAFDGREYTDAPTYPVSREWAEGFGYVDNSRRTALMAQTSLRDYFQPSGQEMTFNLREVNIPLQAFGADPASATPPATDAQQAQPQQGGRWDSLINTVMQGVTTVGVGLYDNKTKQQQMELEAKLADSRAREAASLEAMKSAGSGGGGTSGTTIALVAVLGVAALGAVYFFTKSDGE